MPRFAGSGAEADARQYCASRLAEAGFAIAEESFGYSRLPSSLVVPAVSFFLAVVAFFAAHFAIGHSMPAAATLLAIGGGIHGALLARYLTGRAVLAFPWGRATATNLVATRSTAAPSIWLVAHLDSKSQTIPMLLRIAAISSLVVFYVLLTLVLAGLAVVAWTSAGDRMLEHRLAHAIGNLAHVVVFSAVPLLACFTRNRSPGAADNASGVAAVLLAVKLTARSDVGVLITSAEELGLAGARAFAATGRPPAIAINCDTVDDRGGFICMSSGHRSRRLDAAIDGAVARTGIGTRRPAGSGYRRLRRMLPGVMADNIALSDAGWEAVTLSRGNLGTLARVHTAGDRADSVDGTGIALAAVLIAGTVEEIN